MNHLDTTQYKFRFEPFLKSEYELTRDPDRPICMEYDAKNPMACPRGVQCPFKHVSSLYQNKIVCKHWLRGLCKKGAQCEFLHEYNLRKMPECLFYSKHGYCMQAAECQYRHVKPTDSNRIDQCSDYDHGYCPLGKECPKQHVFGGELCESYLLGFCPLGPSCVKVHLNLDGDINNYIHIRKDSEINTRRADMEKERRLNAILRGEE